MITGSKPSGVASLSVDGAYPGLVVRLQLEVSQCPRYPLLRLRQPARAGWCMVCTYDITIAIAIVIVALQVDTRTWMGGWCDRLGKV